MRLLLLLALAALVLAGCGSDTTVQVGEPGKKGVVRGDIDRAKDVANQAGSRVQQGNKDMSGL